MFQLQIIHINKPLTTDSSYIVVTMMLIISIDPIAIHWNHKHININGIGNPNYS